MNLYEHQKIALNHLQENEHFALFMEQGTGKTLPTLQHILDLSKAGKIKNALVITPKAARGAWQRDIRKFFNPIERAVLNKVITPTTYDLIWRRPELEREWNLICLDESHYIKSRTSNRYSGQMKTINKKRVRVTHGIKGISTEADYKYILSGTPIGNSHWEEIWAQYNFLDPSIFGEYSDFEKRYCVLNQYYRPWKYLNVDEIKEKIFAHSYWVKKEDCLDLPDKLPPESFSVELLEKKLYEEMLKNYISELDIEAKNPLARMTKLRQMCSGFIADEDKKVHKLKCEKASILKEFLENWDKKLVIFAEYKQSISDISEQLQKAKIKFVVLDGAQKDKNIWMRFQEDETIKVIVCQYKTANAGIDLFAADTIIFYEPTLSSQIFEQACDRIHRPGQKEKCSYILFETQKTIEAQIWDTLLGHRDFNENELWAYVREVQNGRKHLDI